MGLEEGTCRQVKAALLHPLGPNQIWPNRKIIATNLGILLGAAGRETDPLLLIVDKVRDVMEQVGSVEPWNFGNIPLMRMEERTIRLR
jgi:hypothetical protein